MRVNVEIHGIDQMIRDMSRMADKGKAVLDKVALAGAEYAQPKIRDAVPVGDEDDQHLRDNLKVKQTKRKNRTKSSAQVEVGAKAAAYGFHLETGHMTKSGQHVPGKPFIRNTIDSESEAIGRVMGEVFIKEVGI